MYSYSVDFLSIWHLLARMKMAYGQGRIYIGASGSKAPGNEVPGGPLEDKNKNWEPYFIKFKGAPSPN